MRGLIGLACVLISFAASAEEWVVLRASPGIGEGGPAGILVDLSSLEILDTGIRRARVKIDFLSRRLDSENFGPNTVNFIIWVKSYDCEKQMTHEESMETHLIDGSVHALNRSKNPQWYPAPENRAADPSIDFVCGWKPR
jgi:hypothetical protein